MKKWLVGTSVVLNILVVLVVVVFLIKWESIVIDVFMKPTHERRVSQFEVMGVSPGDIVFVGDSITEGGTWEELFPQFPVRNRGIGGDVTEGVLERLHQVTRGKPAKLFLMIGTNDLGLTDLAPDEVADNINQIVDNVRRESPETQIFVQSVLPRAANYRSRVELLNDATKQRIGGKATWIDLYPLFLDGSDGSILDRFSNDELHLNGEGYLLWRNTILPYVNDTAEAQ